MLPLRCEFMLWKSENFKLKSNLTVTPPPPVEVRLSGCIPSCVDLSHTYPCWVAHSNPTTTTIIPGPLFIFFSPDLALGSCTTLLRPSKIAWTIFCGTAGWMRCYGACWLKVKYSPPCPQGISGNKTALRNCLGNCGFCSGWEKTERAVFARGMKR